jgi:tetratricopeptide (TPR) repeat protein
LATAGAYLRRSTFSFERYLQEYEQTWNFDHHWPAKLPEYERTLYTTWEVSYKSLEHENDNAARLLGLLAYFSNRRFWYELFQAGVSEDLPEWLYGVVSSGLAFESAMRTLTDYCFLEVQVSSSSWSMHMCVHDWTIATLDHDQATTKTQYCYAFDCVGALAEEEDWNSLASVGLSDLAAHARRLEHVCRNHSEAIEHVIPSRMNRTEYIAKLLHQQVQLAAAEKMYVQALDGKEGAVGPEHTSTLSTVGNLGLLYRDQGNLAKAEEMLLRARKGYEAAVGPEHTSTLDTINNLGLLYQAQGNLAKAVEMYVRALQGYKFAEGNHEARITFLEEQLSTLGTTNSETDPDYRHVFERLSISRPEPPRIKSVPRCGGANSQNKAREPRVDHRKRDILSRMFKR